MAAIKNLNYATKLVLDDLQDLTLKNYQPHLQKVIRGYYNLETQANTNVDVVYLTPNVAGIAMLPDNYIYHTKIGINIGGCLVTLSRNTNLAATPNPNILLPCVDLESATAAISSGSNPLDIWNYGLSFQSHWRNGQFVGEMYGLGTGWNSAGYYNINSKLRTIAFSGVPLTTDIVMEYVSAGEANMSTIVDAKGADVCRMYCHWQNSKVKGYPYGDPDRNKEEYEALLYQYKDMMYSPTASDLLDVFYDIAHLSY